MNYFKKILCAAILSTATTFNPMFQATATKLMLRPTAAKLLRTSSNNKTKAKPLSTEHPKIPREINVSTAACFFMCGYYLGLYLGFEVNRTHPISLDNINQE